MDEQLKSNLTSSKHWVRLVYMLLFSFFLYIASFVVALLVVVQFVFALITGSDNGKLRQLGSSASLYIKDVLMFLTFNSEHKPFPFADWPEPSVVNEAVVTASEAEVENVGSDTEPKSSPSAASVVDDDSSEITEPSFAAEEPQVRRAKKSKKVTVDGKAEQDGVQEKDEDASQLERS